MGFILHKLANMRIAQILVDLVSRKYLVHLRLSQLPRILLIHLFQLLFQFNYLSIHVAFARICLARSISEMVTLLPRCVHTRGKMTLAIFDWRFIDVRCSSVVASVAPSRCFPKHILVRLLRVLRHLMINLRRAIVRPDARQLLVSHVFSEKVYFNLIKSHLVRGAWNLRLVINVM